MATNERLRVVTERLLSDARQSVTDLQITEDEIHTAASFLDRLGQANEFSDMLDIFLGVTSVIATHGVPNSGTVPNLAGPYYKAGAPVRTEGRLFDGGLPEGETPLTVRGRVLDAATDEPVTDAILDLWQADGRGVYDETGYHLRGLIEVDDDGRYEFQTVLPEAIRSQPRGRRPSC